MEIRGINPSKRPQIIRELLYRDKLLKRQLRDFQFSHIIKQILS